jgi:DNA-binding IscR family transcriptional regulator
MIFLRDQKRPLLFTEIHETLNLSHNEFSYLLRKLRKNQLVEQRKGEYGHIVGYILSLRGHEILNAFEKSILTYLEMQHSKSF